MLPASRRSEGGAMAAGTGSPPAKVSRKGEQSAAQGGQFLKFCLGCALRRRPDSRQGARGRSIPSSSHVAVVLHGGVTRDLAAALPPAAEGEDEEDGFELHPSMLPPRPSLATTGDVGALQASVPLRWLAWGSHFHAAPAFQPARESPQGVVQFSVTCMR